MKDLVADNRVFSEFSYKEKTPGQLAMEQESRDKSQYARERRVKFRKMKQSLKYQPYRYLCVADFEATCDEGSIHKWTHEIIEFPVVLIDLQKNATVIDEFHTYVRPTKVPTLTEFCKKLTGITQDSVDSAPTLDQVLEDFEEWRISRGLVYNKTHKNFAFVTHGPWDLRNFLDGECKRKAINKPKYFDSWIDLKLAFSEFYKLQQRPIKHMLKHFDLTFKGREHSGLDDSRNLARVAMKMVREGAILCLNKEIDLFQLSR